MKLLLCLLIFFVPAVQLSAQITVTNATFPALGDTLRMSIDNSVSGITIDPPGFNYNWDYSQLLQADNHQQTIYKPASDGSVSVPGATLFVQLDANTQGYYAATANSFQKIAQYGPVQGSPNLTALMKFTPPFIERHAPLNFFDIYQQSSNVLVGWSAAEVPPSFFQQVGMNPDSIRVRITYSRTDVVDASGTLTIPNGSFEVLREKRILYKETYMDGKVQPLGWVEITSLARQNAGITGLGTDTTGEYYFWSNNSKEPIAILHMQSPDFDDLIVTRAEFKNMEPEIICNPPTGLKVSKITATSAKLSWTFPDASVTKIKILYRAKGDAVWTIKRRSSPSGSIALTGLLPNTTYQWKVQSLCTANSTHSAVVKGPDFKTLAAFSANNIVNIYPNPVTGNMMNVRFTNENAAVTSLTVTDLQGQSFISEKMLQNKGTVNKTIDVSALPKGIYVLKIINEKGEQQQIKFVKEN